MSCARELLVAVIGAATVLVGMPTIFTSPPTAGLSRPQHKDVAQTDREAAAAVESERESESDEEGSDHDHLWLVQPANSPASAAVDPARLTSVDCGRRSARPRLGADAIRGPPARS